MKCLEKYDCIQIGDWVRFMRDGKFVIGEVRYIIDDYPSPVAFYTDAGSVPAKSILEHRHQSVPGSDGDRE